MKANEMPFEVPWLATYSAEKNALGLHDKQGYDAWLPVQFADRQRAMIVAYPLVYDTPAYHAAAFRYYRGCVLPLIAEDYGEPNLESMHDVLARMFLPPALVPKKRGRGLRLKRKSTSMESLTCEQFCDFLDRVIVWAVTDRGLIVPMADPAWKWKQQRAGLAQAS